VAECSIGITTAEVVNGEDLYVSVYLPDLMVGTVGGGTTLATQQEALRLMGVVGSTTEKTVDTFAQIVAGAVLAGEISLLSSLEQGALAQSHQRLARGGTSV
jgi:hydroxymethylglutaryl-CoA reductase (NADPH)